MPTSTTTPRTIDFLNPDDSTEISYPPAGRVTNVKVPSELVRAVFTIAVPLFRACTSMLAIAAPEESLTVPLIDPLVLCPATGTESKTAIESAVKTCWRPMPFASPRRLRCGDQLRAFAHRRTGDSRRPSDIPLFIRFEWIIRSASELNQANCCEPNFTIREHRERVAESRRWRVSSPIRLFISL